MPSGNNLVSDAGFHVSKTEKNSPGVSKPKLQVFKLLAPNRNTILACPGYKNATCGVFKQTKHPPVLFKTSPPFALSSPQELAQPNRLLSLHLSSLSCFFSHLPLSSTLLSAPPCAGPPPMRMPNDFLQLAQYADGHIFKISESTTSPRRTRCATSQTTSRRRF